MPLYLKAKEGIANAYGKTNGIGRFSPIFDAFRKVDNSKYDGYSELIDIIMWTYYNRMDLLGHGTTRSNARRILCEGLFVRHDDLLSHSIPLLDYSKTFKMQEKEIIDTLMHWPHLRLDVVVLLALPNGNRVEYEKRQHYNSFLEYDIEKRKYILRREYIIGYLDAKKGRLVRNEWYDALGSKTA